MRQPSDNEKLPDTVEPSCRESESKKSTQEVAKGTAPKSNGISGFDDDAVDTSKGKQKSLHIASEDENDGLASESPNGTILGPTVTNTSNKRDVVYSIKNGLKGRDQKSGGEVAGESGSENGSGGRSDGEGGKAQEVTRERPLKNDGGHTGTIVNHKDGTSGNEAGGTLGKKSRKKLEKIELES